MRRQVGRGTFRGESPRRRPGWVEDVRDRRSGPYHGCRLERVEGRERVHVSIVVGLGEGSLYRE